MNLFQILNTNNWQTINVNYLDIEELALRLSRKPSLYQIQTNTPVDVLRRFQTRNDRKHYNIGQKIDESLTLVDDFKILPKKDGDLYTIYSGHTSILRQRFKEHFVGSQGTACLALFELESLRNFNWTFSYFDLSNDENYRDSKLVRTFLEQRHRANIGWPILCSQ